MDNYEVTPISKFPFYEKMIDKLGGRDEDFVKWLYKPVEELNGNSPIITLYASDGNGKKLVDEYIMKICADGQEK